MHVCISDLPTVHTVPKVTFPSTCFNEHSQFALEKGPETVNISQKLFCLSSAGVDKLIYG